MLGFPPADGSSSACWQSRSIFPAVARAAMPEETKEQRDERMAWWREAQFGMFIHWGVYAVPAGEWNGKNVTASASGS